VVKELVENSLDAEANQISVEVQRGGVDLIKVADNGLGIPASEVELSCRRYATSKISSLADLESISSLGFRGEALFSIAAVAGVEILTKAASDVAGTYMQLKKGDVSCCESRSRAQGTTVAVRRLFHYFPARLKFLKSVNSENSYIANILSQYALAFPEVKFKLFLDKRLGLQTIGNGDLRDVVNQIYGLEIAQRMLEVESGDAFGEISGLVSPPSLSRSDRNRISFFVNRRWIHSPLLMRATEAAYHGLLMDGKHPVAIIDLSLPAEEIDVNVHPSKAQVKFHHGQAIFAIVKDAVKRTLARTPIAKPVSMPFPAVSWSRPDPWMVEKKEPVPITAPHASGYGFYLIDQHAAHERILYERISAQWLEREIEVQGLLQTITIELSPREEEILGANKEILAQFGFTIEPFGDRSYLIRTVPALAAKADVIEIISTLLGSFADKSTPALWEEKIVESLACHSAIRAGQQLRDEEMRELIRQLEQAKQPRTCPHGRPTMLHFSSRQLEKEFGRVS